MRWWGLPRAVEAEYRALKADQSALDNNDLLRMAYEALRDYPAIRAAYEGRFKMVMIDEFQDTDQMQVDLIRYLTGAGERALCTVGDAQQSIYRFRGAEVEVFRRQERKVGLTAAPMWLPRPMPPPASSSNSCATSAVTTRCCAT